MNEVTNIEAIIERLNKKKEIALNKSKAAKDLEDLKYAQGEALAIGECIIECYEQIVNINRKNLS